MRRRRTSVLLPLTLMGVLTGGLLWSTLRAQAPAGPAGADRAVRALPRAKPYLNMPPRADGPMPALLSQTGAFDDVRTLTPAAGLIPYELNVSFWSDGARKQRWIAVPAGGDAPSTIRFSADGAFGFPAGTVFVKHFEFDDAAAQGHGQRRVETRLLVRDVDRGVYGVTYRWRADGSDAELLDGADDESFARSEDPAGSPATVRWHFPSRTDCLACHRSDVGGVLGVNARQLNRRIGSAENQLLAWSQAGLFDHSLMAADVAAVPALAPADDERPSLEQRVRSYLDVNCAQCHHPGGVTGEFDARYTTPLGRQQLIDGRVHINLGLDHARVVAPRDPWRSMVLARVATLEQPKMPPLAHGQIDTQATDLLRRWIESLPGPPVAAPPSVSPAGGDFASTVRVALTAPDPSVEIRYTLDGSPPGPNAARYEQPIALSQSATVRARAFKPGATRSIITQETYIVVPSLPEETPH